MDRAAILQQLDAIERQFLVDLQALRRVIEGGGVAADQAADRQLAELADDLIDTAVAAERFQMPMDRVRRWCREGCGTKRGGRHLASISAFRARLGLG